MTTKPEIRLKSGWHLERALGNGDFNFENVNKIIVAYRNKWPEFEDKLLSGMTDALNLQFYKDVIDVYVVERIKSSFSDPLVISTKYDPDLFVDVLTHELLHVLLTDNTLNLNVREIWGKMFPDISERLTLNHLLVHAVHKHLYLDVMKEPDRLERDVKRCQQWDGYKEAWGIVEARGYKEIISEFKSHY